MKALYSTHKHIRVFVFGVPEGWQVAVYDLEHHEWIAGSKALHCTFKEAQSDAITKVAAMLGKNPLSVKWH